MYCQNLKNQKNTAKYIIDEVHNKSPIRYVGNHNAGYGSDHMKPAKTMLCLMVCLLFGAHAFGARIIPMYSISGHFIYEQVLTLITILHNSFGYVFLVMTDNLKANITFFRILGEKHGRVNRYSVMHPIQNSIFTVLFDLYDPTHFL